LVNSVVKFLAATDGVGVALATGVGVAFTGVGTALTTGAGVGSLRSAALAVGIPIMKIERSANFFISEF
jgi:uncharacterized membrane protein (DUF441 family)